MLLKLLIKGHCLDELEINFPNDPELSFEGNCQMKEMYVSVMVNKLKNRYQRLLEDRKWEIILIAESKMNTQEQFLKIA